jgi:hypothetical protein
MSFFRTRVIWLAAATLVAQIGLIAAASSALCCDHGEAGTTSMADCAACAHGASTPHTCPMKKRSGEGPALKSCCDVHLGALAVLLGSAAIPEPAQGFAPALAESSTLAIGIEQLLARVRPPDLPPPRG